MRALAFALALALSAMAHAANPADSALLEWHKQVRGAAPDACAAFARRVKAATTLREAGVPAIQAHGLDTRADWRVAVLLAYRDRTTPERAAQLCREWGAR